MPKKWLFILNAALLGLTACILLFAVGINLFRTDSFSVPEVPEKERALPKSAFSLEKGQYDKISESLFDLNFSPLKIQLPDLRRVITYYGVNGRPDSSQFATAVHISLANSDETATVVPGEKLYLRYDQNSTPPKYVFSPDNQVTPLWIEVDPEGSKAEISVFYRNEDGNIVRTPDNLANFTLDKKEFTRFRRGEPWNVGSFRADGTLLSRMKTKWYGKDLFLQKHGGELYEEVADLERVDFNEGENGYSVFLGLNDILVWDEGRWKKVEPGPESLGKPLLQVKKITDRLMTFDLWNPDGTQKVILNLLKSRDRWSPKQLQNSFKYISARTRSQFVFEVDGERIILSPQDWLLKTQDKWDKLDTIEEIDNYVERKTVGPLFIFEGLVKKEDEQALSGTLFSPSRSEMESIQLDIPQSSITVIQLPKIPEIELEEEEDLE